MQLSSICSQNDVEYCVDMYRTLSDEAFMPTSREVAISNLWKLVRMKRFVRCLRRDDRIIAWLYAERVQLMHTDYPIFQQMYYASDQTGLRAVRCVTTLHDAMRDYAAAQGYPMVTSPGSHLDPDYTFARILEKHGWLRRGYAAALHI